MIDEIWTGRDCAEYLKLERSYFLRVTRHKQGFPKELPFSEGGRPRWSSLEVRKWALGGDSPSIYPTHAVTA